MSGDENGILSVLIARIPVSGVAAFTAYEDQVLPLLAEHGGVLQRRLRSDDGQTEVHLVWFPSMVQHDRYRADPRRAAHAHLMAQSGASTELLRLQDVA